MIEKKVYPGWAFSKDYENLSKINSEIYKELTSKYKISVTSKRFKPSALSFQPIDFNKYDLIYDQENILLSPPGTRRFFIRKRNTALSDDEIALILDEGNLCFGYRKQSDECFVIYVD